MNARKLLFLDRDGTLIVEPPDEQVDSFDKFAMIDGVIAALQKCVAAGYELVMVTNQDGLGTPAFPQSAFDGGTRGAGAVFPRKPGGIAGNPDGHGLLYGTRLNRNAFEFVEAAVVRCFFLVKEFAENRDAFLETSDSLGVFDAHDFVLQGLGWALFVGSTQTNRQPGPAGGDDIQARPLLG